MSGFAVGGIIWYLLCWGMRLNICGGGGRWRQALEVPKGFGSKCRNTKRAWRQELVVVKLDEVYSLKQNIMIRLEPLIKKYTPGIGEVVNYLDLIVPQPRLPAPHRSTPGSALPDTSANQPC